MPQDLLWLDGNITRIEDGRVSVEDRGFNFSDGIYEVILACNGRPFMLREHLERWEFSAAGIMLASPGTLAEREARILDLLERSGHRSAAIYGQLTRGSARRNHLFPDEATTPPTELWWVRPAPVYASELRANGVTAISHPDERWLHCQYKTIGLLANVLAKERAKRAGAWEAILYREDGTVTESAVSNAWCVRQGTLYTHPLTPRILGGMTRKAVLALAAEFGMPVREEAVTLDQFRKADEAFVSSTTIGVMPVTKLDGAPIGTGRPGPITVRLMNELLERMAAGSLVHAVAK